MSDQCGNECGAECDSQLHSRLLAPVRAPADASDAELAAVPPRARPAVPVAYVVLSLLAVQASFGFNSVIVKIALRKSADPVVFSFLRDVGGAIVLLLACKANNCLVWPRYQDLTTFLLLGILGVYIGQMFLVFALQYVEPLHAAVLQPLQPVLTTLLAAATRTEALDLHLTHGKLKLTGVLLAAAGAVCTVMWASQHPPAAPAHERALRRFSDVAPSPPSSQPDSTPSLAIGYSLLLVQSLGGALYQLVQKHLLSSAEHTYPPLAVAAIGYVVGACSIALVLPICSLGRSSWTFLADPMALGALAYAVFMTSAFNYALQAYANKHSSPTLVTAFFPMQIVFTALFSWIALGHVPQPSDYAGAAMIVGGLAAVTAGRWLHTRRAS